ncbi:MAG: amino acid ABC transporter ATP-binding protein [Clostridia bacterium]|nr:amino acid ABC transporter ATP-binding protein [Clostridia bacterium]
MEVLRVENIQKSFGKTEVLKGIDFSLNEGEVLSVIGSSGSGKTTLLRCLNFLETPQKGRILVGGKVLFDAEDKAKQSDAAIRLNRLHFGLVFQQFNLFPQYTVKKNVTLAESLFAKEKIKKEGNYKGYTHLREAYAAIDEKADKLLEEVGLLAKSESYPCELSGGQQQRVAIARALAMEPQILCFDEPTSALDPELTGEVLRVIRELKEKGRTMIIVTHEIEFARDVSDTIMFMDGGVVAEMGAPSQVIENPQNERTRAFLSRFNER